MKIISSAVICFVGVVVLACCKKPDEKMIKETIQIKNFPVKMLVETPRGKFKLSDKDVVEIVKILEGEHFASEAPKTKSQIVCDLYIFSPDREIVTFYASRHFDYGNKFRLLSEANLSKLQSIVADAEKTERVLEL